MKQSLLALAVCLALAACSKPAPTDTAAAPADAAATAPAADTAAPADAAPAPPATGGDQVGVKMIRLSCPGGVALQAADGGPVLINGEPAAVKAYPQGGYDATDAASGTTVSVLLNPDGSQSASYTGKGGANGVCTVEDAAPAAGKVALLNATCPGGLELHAADGGQVFVNGQEAKLDIKNPGYYEVTDAASGTVIAVATDAQGQATVSYTGKGGANGICTVK